MKIKPFKGFRPEPDKVAMVASRPYDVLDSDEARREAQGNPYSFLNVVKPEITLPPGTDPCAGEVYQAGRDNFRKLLQQGVFFQDPRECLYIYELVMGEHAQTGIVACAWVEDYLQGRIRKHELTRPDKEADRKNHVRVSMLNAEPVFFAYRARPRLDAIVADIKAGAEPLYDFTADDGVSHRLWVVDDPAVIAAIVAEFEDIPATYVADGHHRTAAAALVGSDLRQENPDHRGDEEYNYFLAVHFPDNQLEVYDYNRVVTDLNGYDKESFLAAVSAAFEIEKRGKEPCKPASLHEMGMYLDGDWYALKARPGTWDDDSIGVLDVTLLSHQILEPVLGIHDLRTDKRIDFVGGIRGLKELERRVDSGEMAVAFALHPVTMQQIMAIADAGLIMPPKVTWFEPKLRSGLVVHSLED